MSRSNRSSIFEKQRLEPGQVRAVANRRMQDVNVLMSRKRTNAAMYFGGFVIECLLKAKLLEKYAWLRRHYDPSQLARNDLELHRLCYKEHNLEGLMIRLSELMNKLARDDQNTGRINNGYLRILQRIAADWTIFARYSPKVASCSDARDFVEKVKEIRECLK